MNLQELISFLGHQYHILIIFSLVTSIIIKDTKHAFPSAHLKTV